MPHTQWRPPSISLLNDPAELLAQHAPGPFSESDMSGSLYDLGVPFPIWDDQPDRIEASARSAALMGSQVHAAIARLAPLVALIGEDDLMIEAAITSLVKDRRNGNLRRARAHATGLVRHYLRVFLPTGGVFAGSEVPAAGGRADLLWSHPSGFFYDEVKTTTLPTPITPEVLNQIGRYVDAGNERFGTRFAGVRLITLRQTSAALFLSPVGELSPLSTSPLAPTALGVAAYQAGGRDSA